MPSSTCLIALPLLSFLILLLFGTNLPKIINTFVGVLGLAGSFLLSCYLFVTHLSSSGQKQIVWNMLPNFDHYFQSLSFSLTLDSLSLTMALMVSFVSFFIAVYSTAYMAQEEGFIRFFATINLFVAFMLLLILADSLLLLFIGWEGVGICSYVLIGFYYREKAAELAAMKAFLMTRVGDIFLLFAIFIALNIFKTTSIADINSNAHALILQNSSLLNALALCLLIAALGKSAQIPLQTWLPDAMWGPTPVSALIHAATMVTAGVYLLARMSPILALSETSQTLLLYLGAFSLLLGGFAALAQTDLKRVLAYSTMSQIGYMFLALAVGAPQAAIFHLVTHAFFKALLFLTAGVIGHAVHSYDMHKMGGLFRKMPLVSVLFFIGAASLVGLPFVSSGFFSKEWILSQALEAKNMGLFAYAVGIMGVFVTALYTTRMVLLVFFGSARSAIHNDHSPIMILPLIILAICSTLIGWVETPTALVDIKLFSNYVASTLHQLPALGHHSLLMLFLPNIVSLLGIFLALLLVKTIKTQQFGVVGQFFKDGAGFDRLYIFLLVKPYVHLSKKLALDMVDTLLLQLKHAAKIILQTLDKLHHKSIIHHLYLLIGTIIALASFVVLS